MRRTILFIPQNDSHAETAALLQPGLEERGFRSVVLDMDDVYHQGTARFLKEMEVLPTRLTSEVPFYRMSPFRQMRIVAAARPQVQQWLEGVDALVAFNDGALQRLILAAARRRGTPVDLVLDGMVTDQREPRSPRNLIRQVLRSGGQRLGDMAVAAFLPSEVGLAAVDRTHVAGEHSAAVLMAHGCRARRILASGLPRWPDPERNPPTKVKNVLYLTGAFRWHNDHATARAQEADAVELAEACHSRGLTLFVRVHPRDDAERYAGLNAKFVDPRAESITATIRGADLVLSIISTGLVEAIILGKPCRAMAIHPSWSRYRRAFVADPLFAPIRSTDDLHLALEEMSDHVDAASLERQRAGVARYVAATGSEATDRVVSAIAAGQ